MTKKMKRLYIGRILGGFVKRKTRGECRKRKTGHKSLGLTSSSCSSSSCSSSSSSSSEEAEIVDGRDVLEDEGTGTVIPSSLTESEEESFTYVKGFARWKRDCQCATGTSEGDCACDAGF
jgi:hypothetical protein